MGVRKQIKCAFQVHPFQWLPRGVVRQPALGGTGPWEAQARGLSRCPRVRTDGAGGPASPPQYYCSVRSGYSEHQESIQRKNKSQNGSLRAASGSGREGQAVP